MIFKISLYYRGGRITFWGSIFGNKIRRPFQFSFEGHVSTCNQYNYITHNIYRLVTTNLKWIFWNKKKTIVFIKKSSFCNSVRTYTHTVFACKTLKSENWASFLILSKMKTSWILIKIEWLIYTLRLHFEVSVYLDEHEAESISSMVN